jgi:hypothetical protein
MYSARERKKGRGKNARSRSGIIWQAAKVPVPITEEPQDEKARMIQVKEKARGMKLTSLLHLEV